MKINIINTWQNAVKSNFLFRKSIDDKTITFQELVLFYMLRTSVTSANENDCIDPQETYEKDNDKEYYIEMWNKLSASKIQSMTFDKPWDEVFQDKK